MKRHLLALLGALTVTAAQAQTPTSDEMSRAIDLLNLTDVAVHPQPKGPDVTGDLPGGHRVELDFHRHGGALEEIEAEDHRLFPADAIAALVPDTVRGHRLYPTSGLIEKIEFETDKIEIEGRTVGGQDFKAEFTPAGHLLDYKLD